MNSNEISELLNNSAFTIWASKSDGYDVYETSLVMYIGGKVTKITAKTPPHVYRIYRAIDLYRQKSNLNYDVELTPENNAIFRNR